MSSSLFSHEHSFTKLFTEDLLESLKNERENQMLTIYLRTQKFLSNIDVIANEPSFSSSSESSRTIMYNEIIENLDIMIDYSWELIHSAHWKCIPLVLRNLYSLGVYLKTRAITCKDNFVSISTPSKIKMLIQNADKAILLGCSSIYRTKLQIIIKELTCYYNQILVKSKINLISKPKPLPFSQYQRHTNKRKKCVFTQHPIPEITAPSLVTFYNEYLNLSQPVVIKEYMNDWPAMSTVYPEQTNESCNNELLNSLSYASQSWSNLDYIKSVCGMRTVPVEIGESYLSEDASQILMTIEEYIDKYILKQTISAPTSSNQTIPEKITNSSESKTIANNTSHAIANKSLVGYLAQHRLFDQIPELRNDIIIPDYCALTSISDDEYMLHANTSTQHSDDHATVDDMNDNCNNNDNITTDDIDDIDDNMNYNQDEEIIMNMWLGPACTISPMHFDPYHNLLAQVHGYKYVRLYSPIYSEYLYPMKDRMFNNSEVNVVAPDMQKYPKFCLAPYIETILCPGEMLFIPRGWWHFIKALDCYEFPNISPCSYEDKVVDDSAKNTKNIDKFTSSQINQKDSMNSTYTGHTNEISDINDNNKALFSCSVSFWWGPRILYRSHNKKRNHSNC